MLALDEDDTAVCLKAQNWRVGGYFVEFWIDVEDLGWVGRYKWNCTDDGYIFRRTSRYEVGRGRVGVIRYLHRDIMECGEGDGLEVDHLNSNVLDNRRGNLQILCKEAHREVTAERRGEVEVDAGIGVDIST